jgi:UDP-N-acetyl-D-mannosaminuronate dehydrogenase
VAYKPDVEDLRESPALEVVEGLLAAGARVEYHDPYIPELPLNGARLAQVAAPDVALADLVVVHTLHSNLNLDLVDRAELVLDATYQLSLGPNMVRL